MLTKIVTRYEDRISRIFEIFPGLLLWIILTSPLWLSPSFPRAMANIVIATAAYWLYRSIVFILGLIIGYKNVQTDQKINWLEECKKLEKEELPNYKTLPKSSFLPKQLIVYPIGSAKYETMEKSLEAIDNLNYPKDLVYISLSFEQRLIDKEPEYFKGMKEKIRKQFSHFGNRLMIFDHPGDIPGEAIGAAANRTWGTKMAVEELERRGENIADFLTTSPDEDLRFHPEFFAAIAYKYLTNENRYKKFFQTGAYFFYNNYWDVPMIIRTWCMSLSLPVLSSSVTEPHDRETWSCYTLNLDLMKKVNYWDTSIGIDDTPFFWRPFNYLDGDFSCEVFFVPLYADAVYHPNKFQNYKAQYKQLVRWGWGVITFPIAMKTMLKNEKISWFTRIYKFLMMTRVFVILKLVALILTFAVPLIGIINPTFNQLIYSSLVPQTLSIIMRGLTLLVIPLSFFRYLLTPKVPETFGKLKATISFLIEVPLQVLILYTFAFLPFIIGPTRMMLGHSYEFFVTPKK